jgi:hypothetical protein
MTTNLICTRTILYELDTTDAAHPTIKICPAKIYTPKTPPGRARPEITVNGEKISLKLVDGNCHEVAWLAGVACDLCREMIQGETF